MGNEEKPSSSSAVKLGLWLSFIAFCLLIVLFRGNLTEITFGDKGVSAKMLNAQDVSKLSPEEKQNAEKELNDRISRLEKEARANPQPAPMAQQPAPVAQQSSEAATGGELSNAGYREPQVSAPLVNLAGWWSAADASTYQITQNGSYITLQGYMFGQRLLVGTGQLTGQVLNLQTQAVTGEIGRLELQVSPDQRHLTGGFQSGTTGLISAIQLNR